MVEKGPHALEADLCGQIVFYPDFCLALPASALDCAAVLGDCSDEEYDRRAGAVEAAIAEKFDVETGFEAAAGRRQLLFKHRGRQVKLSFGRHLGDFFHEGMWVREVNEKFPGGHFKKITIITKQLLEHNNFGCVDVHLGEFATALLVSCFLHEYPEMASASLGAAVLGFFEYHAKVDHSRVTFSGIRSCGPRSPSPTEPLVVIHPLTGLNMAANVKSTDHLRLVFRHALDSLSAEKWGLSSLLSHWSAKVSSTQAKTQLWDFAPSEHVYIGNLPPCSTAASVLCLVEQVIETTPLRVIVRQKIPGGAKYGFVWTHGVAEAEAVIEALDGLVIVRHHLKVYFASAKCRPSRIEGTSGAQDMSGLWHPVSSPRLPSSSAHQCSIVEAKTPGSPPALVRCTQFPLEDAEEEPDKKSSGEENPLQLPSDTAASPAMRSPAPSPEKAARAAASGSPTSVDEFDCGSSCVGTSTGAFAKPAALRQGVSADGTKTSALRAILGI